mmetsp:Transcript_46980/g.147208  ORF Transcript_46980/g.147208 Transcript_46980/m.147208 type:complete len:91 (-) Transcript_46980:822-1094(-)
MKEGMKTTLRYDIPSSVGIPSSMIEYNEPFDFFRKSRDIGAPVALPNVSVAAYIDTTITDSHPLVNPSVDPSTFVAIPGKTAIVVALMTI